RLVIQRLPSRERRTDDLLGPRRLRRLGEQGPHVVAADFGSPRADDHHWFGTGQRPPRGDPNRFRLTPFPPGRPADFVADLRLRHLRRDHHAYVLGQVGQGGRRAVVGVEEDRPGRRALAFAHQVVDGLRRLTPGFAELAQRVTLPLVVFDVETER